MGACHRDLDGLAREGRDHLEFIDEAEINIVSNGTPADGRRMKDVGVVRGDRLGPRLAMETGNLLPEMIEHRVRRRMPIVPPSVHLAAGNHVDAGDFLLEDGRLRRAQLRVHQIAFAELAKGNKAVQCFVPSRHAVRPHHCGRVPRIKRHACERPLRHAS